MNICRRLIWAVMFAVVPQAAAAWLATMPALAGITYDMVNVGNPGNANDTTGYGAVNYLYSIGTYDVTIGQYTAFLNAVAATDTNALYNASMATDLNVAGISRSGSSESFSYSVITNGGSIANRPITYVDWRDAARSANFMSNGQPTGAVSSTTTENGAYDLTGGTYPARKLLRHVRSIGQRLAVERSFRCRRGDPWLAGRIMELQFRPSFVFQPTGRWAIHCVR